MVITDIKIRKMFNDKPMKAIASVTLDGQLAVHDIKVISARESFHRDAVAEKSDGTYRDIVHPINSAFRAEIESAVIRAYQDACEAQAQSENEGASSESEAQGEADENNGEKSESET